MDGPWEKAVIPGQCSGCLPGTIPGPGERRREDALHPHLQGFLKGTGKREWLCHRSYEPDLSGLIPYLFMNGGRFPVSCFPGVILNSQPFVPRHRPGSGTSAPAPHGSPFQPGRHRALFSGAGQGQAMARWDASAQGQLSVSPLLILARLAGAFWANSCVRCCLMGVLAAGQHSGGRDRGDLPNPPAMGLRAAGITHPQGGRGQAVALMYLQISSLKIGWLKGWV